MAESFSPTTDGYSAITDEIYQKFLTCCSFEEEYNFLLDSKALTVPFADENPRNKIIAEYFYKVINYCKSNRFNSVQTKICCQLFEVIIKFAQTETEYGAATKALVVDLFKQKLLEFNRPEGEADVFSPNDIKLISVYFLKSILTQLTAFQYILQRPVLEHLYETKVVVQTPIGAPPLATATLQEEDS